MNANELKELFEYSVKMRRDFHEYPEIEFELDRTVGIVKDELTKMGIDYTTDYGVASVVADIGQGEELVAIRADMDALPVEEKADVPFKSKIPGKMHACGHDLHTGILLAVAKYLKAHEKELKRRVRLIFQPNEEGVISGAQMMVENGVMEGVDQIICTHCDNDIECGMIGICPGYYMASCVSLTVKFFGRTAHAAFPNLGIDAGIMSVEAYMTLNEMVKEEAGDTRYIWCSGKISAGQTHNVIPDMGELNISYRFYDSEFASRVEKRVREICDSIAKKHGGRCEVEWVLSTGTVYNDEKITDDFVASCKEAGVETGPMPQRMSSEDFCWYLDKAPGMIFRFGTRNEAEGCTALAHRNDFKVDENGMMSPLKAFIAYVMR